MGLDDAPTHDGRWTLVKRSGACFIKGAGYVRKAANRSQGLVSGFVRAAS